MSNTYVLHTSERGRGNSGICNSTKCSGISQAGLVQHFHFQVHEIWWRSVLVNAWAVAELALSLSPSPTVSRLGCSQSVSLACVKLNPKTQVPIPTVLVPTRSLSHSLTRSHLTEQHLSQRKHLNGKMKHYDDSWKRSPERSERTEIEIESVYCELQNNEL